VLWLLACFYLVLITGCTIPAVPLQSNLEIRDDTQLPNISLVRRVLPEAGKEYRERHPMFSSNYYADVESESQFGNPDEDADLSCIYTGLKDSLPGIDILSSKTFWEQVATPHEVVELSELSELFVGPQLDRLHALQTDILVIAYHARINVENTKMETLIAGAFDNKDKETAAIIVVDPNRKSIIHGSRITFEDEYFFYHILIFPVIWAYTPDPPDICNTVARQAGIAIAETMPDSPIRALIVMATEYPIAAVQSETENRAREEKFAQELAKLEFEANKGNTDAQLEIFKGMRASNPTEALRWLCYSADLGNQEAREVLAEIYEYGGYIWIKDGNIEHDYKLAYVWRGMSGQYHPVMQQIFAGRYLTTEELSEAKKCSQIGNQVIVRKA
jgi:hypothetical protein